MLFCMAYQSVINAGHVEGGMDYKLCEQKKPINDLGTLKQKQKIF